LTGVRRVKSAPAEEVSVGCVEPLRALCVGRCVERSPPAGVGMVVFFSALIVNPVYYSSPLSNEPYGVTWAARTPSPRTEPAPNRFQPGAGRLPVVAITLLLPTAARLDRRPRTCPSRGGREAARALKANRAQLQTIVNDLVPGLTERRGIGPVSAAQAIVSFSHPGRCRNDAAFAASPGPARLRPAAAARCGTGSTGAETAPSTGRSTPSP